MASHALQQPKLESSRDRASWYVALAAIATSVIAYVTTAQHHAVLAYGDAVSHLEIARRTLDGTSPGLAQMGGVWPPLPHLLMLPLVWNNALYYNGFAGSIVSMAAYVVTAVLVYKIVTGLTGKKFAGVVGAVVFGLSINMLYMQSTPMTEALLFCLLAAAVYCTQQWATTDQSRYLVGAGIAALLATLTRYESWPILACLLLAVGAIAWHKRQTQLPRKLQRARARDRLIVFTLPAFAGVLAWLAWNWAIFGSPFNFQGGDYARPSLWLSGHEPAIHNWWISLKTYWYAMGDDVTWPVLWLAIVGLACFLAFELRHKRSAIRALPVLSLLVMVPFFVVSLYTGQRPLHVLEITGGLYNVRFGLIMLLPAAIFVGYLVGALQRLRPALMYAGGAFVILAVFLIGGMTLDQASAITFREAQGSTSPFEKHVAATFQRQYDGGRVLMETFGNEGIAFKAIPSNKLVYEGSYRQWVPALRSPSTNHITWIVARCGTSADKVCQMVNQGEFARYNLVDNMPDKATGNVYHIYRIKPEFQHLSGA